VGGPFEIETARRRAAQGCQHIVCDTTRGPRLASDWTHPRKGSGRKNRAFTFTAVHRVRTYWYGYRAQSSIQGRVTEEFPGQSNRVHHGFCRPRSEMGRGWIKCQIRSIEAQQAAAGDSYSGSNPWRTKQLAGAGGSLGPG